MRPDRIVIGEVRGPEALDLLTALNTGHEGALSTLHANSAADALSRLETLALMAGVGLPHEAIAEQVQRGVDLVVHVERRARRLAPRRRDRRGGPGRGRHGRSRPRCRAQAVSERLGLSRSAGRRGGGRAARRLGARGGACQPRSGPLGAAAL